MIKTALIFISAFIGTTTAILSDPPNSKEILTEYDFIIVGSGPAGCVLANRLSEVSNWKVLLLEAGKRGSCLSEVPKMTETLLPTDYNWKYKMEYTPTACLGNENQRCSWAAGKGLGGGSLINHMVYSRGNRMDFDLWAAAGNPGWSYDEVLPYFKKSETSTVKMQEPDYHNHSGPWFNEDVNFRPVISETFLDAGKELGYPVVDYNGVSQIGFSYVQANTKNGVRQSSYSAFIQPAEKRPNLHIVTRARVTKIIINNTTKTANGVIFAKNRKHHGIFAAKEVILSAGTANSPQLLMLSGVGPKAHLASVGIDAVKDIPGVGQNLKDHLAFPGSVFTVNASVTQDRYLPEDPRSFLQWLFTRKGPMTDNGIGNVAFINTNPTDHPSLPDMEILFRSGKITQITQAALKMVIGISKETDKALMKHLTGKGYCLIIPILLNPQSAGHLELQSKDPFTPPRFYGNYLSDPADIKTAIRAVKMVLKVADTFAFQQYGMERHDIVLPTCKGLRVDSDEYWECIIRHLTFSAYHQIGTCKMGPESDEMAVVDRSGQVHGVGNLRVADCSIIPFPLAGHNTAQSVMIGEKISDAIKARWG